MTDKQPAKNKGGRPRGSTIANPMTSKILVMVTPDKLATYKQAAKLSDKTFSAWVRDTLDDGVRGK